MKSVRYVVGLVLSVVAPILFVPTLYTLTKVGNCGDVGEQVCPPGTATHVVLMVVSIILAVVGAILTLGFGLLFSAIAGGVEVLVKGSGTAAHITGPALIAGPVLLVVIGLIGSSASDKREAALEQFKARATRVPGAVILITDTGVSINDNPRVVLTVEYPDGDGAPVRIERKQVVSRLSLPRLGDPATVWYDPSGAQEAVFELVDASADPDAATTTADADLGFAAVTDSVPEPATGLIASLERLSVLHREGALSDEEFAIAKRRLLGA